MRRADRLFRIVQLLRGRRLTTAAFLADELGVSPRTVYRDIQALVTSGVPIQGEAGVGYTVPRGFELPPLTFTSDEIEALVLGARVASTWGDPDLAAAARSALAKVEQVVPPALRRVLTETAIFAPGGSWSREASSHLGPLRRAVADRRKVRFAYVKADGTASERIIRPLGIYFWGRTWSVVGWCELRQAFRNFRPDRMADVEVLEDGFEDDHTLEHFIAEMEAHGEGIL